MTQEQPPVTVNHTPEPWKLRDTQNGKRFHVIETNYGFIADMNGLPEKSEANAWRIVACVNACAGISTEDLEFLGSGPVKDALHGLDMI